MNKIIFHVDVNSAFLSWEAAHRLFLGDTVDLREIPSVVGGDPTSRRGVVLAKSIPAKAFGVVTGEPLQSALKKCPELTIVKAHFDLYERASKALRDLLGTYSDTVVPFSIDECFLDMSHVTDPIETAYELKDEVYKKLGFTVNVGIGTNKLLAKISSDFKKPNRVHTLFPTEIAYKLWPLPVRNLFMVGKKTEARLHELGIFTVRDLALTPLSVLEAHFKSQGLMLHHFSHGIHTRDLENQKREEKSIGNSTTLPSDIRDLEEIEKVLLRLSEQVSRRLRSAELITGVVTVQYKDTNFITRSHQKKLTSPTDHTNTIYETAKVLFKSFWKKEPIRLLGITLSDLTSNDYVEVDLFQNETYEKNRAIDQTIDSLRERFGKDVLIRASLKKD
ncbi:DNA polymerase Y family protein [Guggenheimella bovis]